MNSVLRIANDLKIAEYLSRGFDWWLDELKSIVPKSLEARWVGEKLNVLIRIDGNAAEVLLGKIGAEAPFAMFTLDGSEQAGVAEQLREFFSEGPNSTANVQVELAERSVLVCEMFLPLATENSLHDVLSYEMNRLTPFSADQVGYAYRVVEKIPERDRLKIRLMVVRRDYLETITDHLKKFGLSVDEVYGNEKSGVFGGSDKGNDLNLLPKDMRVIPEPGLNSKNKRLLAIFLVLLVLVIGYPFMRLSMIKEHLESEISTLISDADRVGKKQRLLISRIDGHELLTRKKNQHAAKIEILRTLTALIPEDTWISNLTVNNEVASLKGESDNASRLVETLEKNPLFGGVKFVSPVVLNPRSRKERFELQVQIKEIGT